MKVTVQTRKAGRESLPCLNSMSWSAWIHLKMNSVAMARSGRACQGRQWVVAAEGNGNGRHQQQGRRLSAKQQAAAVAVMAAVVVGKAAEQE